MSIFKDGKVFVGENSASVEVGSYEIITISESPIKVQVKGKYDTSKAPQGGGGDALHSFENRTKDYFGGAMNSIINSALKDIYNNKKINPYVSEITVDMGTKGAGPVVNWTATLTESPDGKAWIGLSSRGGAGNVSSGTAVARAAEQTAEKKKALPTEVTPNEPNMEFRDVLDYRNEKQVIRQIMFNYTRPLGFPPLPKSGLGPAGPDVTGPITGASGSSASAISSGTPSIALNVVFPEKFEVKAREDVPKFTIWVGDPQPQEQVEGFLTFFDDTQQMDENGNLIGTESEYVETDYTGAEEETVIELNEVEDEPVGSTTTDVGTDTGTTVTENVDVGASPIGPGPPSGSKLVTGSGKSFYIYNSSYGLAGHRLKNIIPDLQKHLRANGYPDAVIKSNGIMRDLVASTYPDSPKRAVASLHGAGLAVDLQFKIAGKKWGGIGDNGNLASDAALNKVIWNFVKAQGDITWGAEWGKSKPADGMVKGWGIVEYHHMEIKSSKIADYWKPFEKDLKAMGFDYKKLNQVGKDGPIYKLNKAILNSKGIA